MPRWVPNAASGPLPAADSCVGAAAGLLLVCCLTSPTRRGLAFTRVTGISPSGEYNMDLGTLGGCSDFLQGCVYAIYTIYPFS